MLKVNELFSGIGAFRKALQRLGIPHEIVGISEIDKYAIKSYEAIFGETRNYGDISKVDRLDYADLWTYGFPCQDISVAGHQAGIVKGETRSGLLYEVQRLLTVSALSDELPKYLILENVKNLVGKKFIDQFNGWLEWLDGLGYNNYWQVLNAKDYGIPQNRERVFVVSVRKDIDTGFKFPEPTPLATTMMDFLENEVDDKYYISDAYIEYAENLTKEMIERKSGIRFSPIERERESNDSENYYHQSRFESNGQFHQGVMVAKQGKIITKETSVCSTLLARDYKGFGNQAMTGVIEYEL